LSPSRLSLSHFEQRIFPQMSELRASSSSNALASLRSGRSKPSVNQFCSSASVSRPGGLKSEGAAARRHRTD
jgi:hypothetical protein